MRLLKKTFLLFAFIVSLGFTQSLRAQSLEVVFKDSLWGAGLGAVIALAAWSMSEEQKTDDLQKNLVRGSSLGLLAGIGYGLWEVNQGGGGLTWRKESPRALTEYDPTRLRLLIRPILPRLAAFDGMSRTWKWTLIGLKF